MECHTIRFLLPLAPLCDDLEEMKRLWLRLSHTISKGRRERSGDPGDLERGVTRDSDRSSSPLPLKVLTLQRVLPTVETVGCNGLSVFHFVSASGRADCLEAILRSHAITNLNVPSAHTVAIQGLSGEAHLRFLVPAGRPWVVELQLSI